MKISVALCTYNGEEYISAQLESIAAQTRPPDELVVCDDRSSDRTIEVIKAFAARAPFPVRRYVNEVNLGSTNNFAKAIGLCQGEIIALSDQDDVWLPGKLERLDEIFRSAPEIGLVFTDAELVDQDLRLLNSRLWDWTFDRAKQSLVASGKAFEALMQGNLVTGATMAFRSSYNPSILPIPEEKSFIHDDWIAFVIASEGQIMPLSEPLIRYRQHSRQQLGIGGVKTLAGIAIPGATKAERARYYTGQIQRLSYFRRRLETSLEDSSGSSPETEARLRMLDEIVKHYRVRGNTLANRAARAPRILKELFRGRYHRYSKGLSSAAIDFMR